MVSYITIMFLIVCSLSSIYAAQLPPSYTNFVKGSCKSTTYPSLCLKTLTPYAATVQKSHLKLCIVALNVSLQEAKNASATVTKIAKQRSISSYQTAALKDCIGEMKDAIYEIIQSLNSMNHLGGADRKFQWASAKTQASAAITDAETCKDGMSGKKTDPSVRNQINSRVSDVQKRISNALYLINHLYKS